MGSSLIVQVLKKKKKKKNIYNAGDLGSIPQSGNPWRREWQPLQ